MYFAVGILDLDSSELKVSNRTARDDLQQITALYMIASLRNVFDSSFSNTNVGLFPSTKLISSLYMK
jgi:hypothetical protein